jgi:hypothetical protein
MVGRPPNPPWATLSQGLSSAAAFVEKLRMLIRYLTTPTNDRVTHFLRIVDADPHWRHYLLGRQRPETSVETMSCVLALFADDDPCAPVEADPHIQRIGTVYDLSAGRQFIVKPPLWD